jgi:hypothetical protein
VTPHLIACLSNNWLKATCKLVPNPRTGTWIPVLPNGRVGTVTFSSEASADKFFSGKADAAPAVQAAFKNALRVHLDSFWNIAEFFLI